MVAPNNPLQPVPRKNARKKASEKFVRQLLRERYRKEIIDTFTDEMWESVKEAHQMAGNHGFIDGVSNMLLGYLQHKLPEKSSVTDAGVSKKDCMRIFGETVLEELEKRESGESDGKEKGE